MSLTNKDQLKEYHRIYRLLNKKVLSEKNKIYRQSHKLELSNKAKIYYENHKLQIKQCSKERYYANPTANNESCHLRTLKTKIIVLTHYGGGTLACVNCGFTDIRALSIDHVNGGGNRHKQLEHMGSSIYYYLKRKHFPSGYQTLCMNCQWLKRD